MPATMSEKQNSTPVCIQDYDVVGFDIDHTLAKYNMPSLYNVRFATWILSMQRMSWAIIALMKGTSRRHIAFLHLNRFIDIRLHEAHDDTCVTNL